MVKKWLKITPIILFTALFLCTLQYTYLNITSNFLNMRMGNLFQTQNAVYLHVSGITTQQLLTLLQVSGSEITIFTPQQEEQVYGFFTTEKEKPQLLSGKQMELIDLSEKHAVALVGQNIQNSGSIYVPTGIGKYDVIGVMGNTKINDIDNAVFLNLSTTEIDESLSINLVIDSAKKDHIQALNFTQWVKQQGGKATVLTDDTLKITDFMGNQWEHDRLFIVLLICYILCAIVVIKQWLYQYKKEILICKMLGMRGMHIFRLTYSRFLSGIATGAAVSIFAGLVLKFEPLQMLWFTGGGLLFFSVCFLMFFLKLLYSRERGDKSENL